MIHQKLILPVIFAVLLIAALSFGQNAAEIKVAGLSGPVVVKRDARAIPYIEAQNDDDLYFMQGYVTASDRLWQMDVMRRVARGQTAEIFGEQALKEDIRWRKLGLAAVAEKSAELLSPELRKALERYSAGVNAYIASLDEKTLPVEFTILQYRPSEWKPSDTIISGKIIADALSSTYADDLTLASLQKLSREKIEQLENKVTPYDVILFGTDKPEKKKIARTGLTSNVNELSAAAEEQRALRAASLERVGLYADGLAASNNWVISGKLTADGKPLLANDPHLRATAPGIWYMTHLSSPTMRVSGVTFPGVPGIVLGHNENMAWGATNVGPDVQDLYLETFDAAGKYKTPTGMAEPVKRIEEIKVKLNPFKPDVRIEKLEVTETRNGPVIVEADGKKYSLKWTALDPKNADFEAFFLVNRAKNWTDFTNALKTYGGATQNFVYADREGHIGWYAAGRIPIRQKGDGALPYDGATTDGDWTGYIPFEQLPHERDPKRGFIMTANQRIVGTDYKQISRAAAAPWRAKRINDLIVSGGKLTAEDMARIQYDAFNVPLKLLGDQALELKALSPAAQGKVKAWDGQMLPDSQTALFLNDLRGCIANEIARENQPVPVSMIREVIVERAIRERSRLWLPAKFSDYGELIKKCETETNAGLERKFGSDDKAWVWGTVMTSTFPHPLVVAPLIGGQFKTPTVPIRGSGQSPNVGSAVSMRHIATPGNWDDTRLGIPLGQSGNARSVHYSDQFEAWRTGKPQTFPFSREAVEKATVSATTYAP